MSSEQVIDQCPSSDLAAINENCHVEAISDCRDDDSASIDSMNSGIPTVDELRRSTDRFLRRLQERKYFDSGDYAIAKTNPQSMNSLMVGQLHPSPERIPHSGSMGSMHHGKSPVKEVLMESCNNISESENESISPPTIATATAAINTIYNQNYQPSPRGERGSGLAP